MIPRLTLALAPVALVLACTPTTGNGPALICTDASGATVAADFPADRNIAVLTLEMDGETSTIGLPQQPTGSGFRYAIPATELRGQGDEATLTMNGTEFTCAPPT